MHTDLDRLRRLAHDSMASAYAPYSKFRVGAALLLSDGRIFTGANVENASFGLTNCAERSAIFSAVSASSEKIQIAAIVVENSQAAACSPCGACRQVIAEFSTPETLVHYRSATGWKQMSIGELLPDGFQL